MAITIKIVTAASLALALFAAAAHAQAPQNDNFAAATVVVGDPLNGLVSIAGDSTNGTKEAGEPQHGLDVGGASIWFRWTAQTSGRVLIDTVGSNFDTLLGVYIGADLQALEIVNLNDDGDGSLGLGVTSSMIIQAQAGVTYMIAVDGYFDPNAEIPASGVVNLNLDKAPAGPANDDLANASELDSEVPSVTTQESNVNGSREPTEPFHAGQFGAASIWFRWVAPLTLPVELSTRGTSFPTLVGIYIDDGGALTEVVAGSGEPVSVVFQAEEGVEYLIAIDGAAGFIQAQGTIGLSIDRAIEVEVFGLGASWEFLHPVTGVDPALADTDFNTTWQDPAASGYNGPAFAASSPAILGYGAIGNFAIGTDIATPGSGNRFTAYFRREFTLSDAMDGAVAEILADDGAVIYIDGNEVGRVNMSDPDTYLALADGIGSETALVRVPIGPLGAGTHTIAVSIHNQSAASSDLGFGLRLFRPLAIFGRELRDGSELCVSFEDSPVGATSYAAFSGGFDFGWQGNGVFGIGVSDNGAGNSFEFNATVNAIFETAIIDVREVTGVVASIDVSTFDTSSGFESNDFFVAFVEGSTDGIEFDTIVEIVPQTFGGSDLDPPNDQLILLGAGGNSTFSTSVGDIPDEVQFLRVIAAATANSGSEHILLDNVCVSIGQPEPSPFAVTSITANDIDGLTIQFESSPGASYVLESSADLASWALTGQSLVATVAISQFTQPGPLDARLFYRVRRL